MRGQTELKVQKPPISVNYQESKYCSIVAVRLFVFTQEKLHTLFFLPPKTMPKCKSV